VPIDGEVDRYELEKMALLAAGVENEEDLYEIDEDDYWGMAMSNFDPNPMAAYQTLIEGVYSSYYDSPHQAFQQLWVDAFGFDSGKYLKAMLELGYDGVILNNETQHGGNDHYIAFSPNQIKAVANEGFSEEDSMYREDKLPKIQDGSL